MLSCPGDLVDRMQRTMAPKIFTLSIDEARSKVREIINQVPQSRPRWRTAGSFPTGGSNSQHDTTVPQSDRRGTLTSARQSAEVRVRRHGDTPDCDVVVTLSQERNIDQVPRLRASSQVGSDRMQVLWNCWRVYHR